MTRVVCIGDVMVDVHARLPGELAIGSDTPATIAFTGGGSAANTAAWLAAAGCAAVFVGRVGDDVAGRQATGELEAAGVQLRVSVDSKLPTGTCIVLVGSDGERTMIPSAGANARGALALGTADLVDSWLHVSGYALFHEQARDAALRSLTAARADGRPVSVDAASAAPLRDYGATRFLDDVAPCLLFANLDEAAALSGTRNPDGAARALGLRSGQAIVKQGAGAAVWSDGRHVVGVPGHHVDVVDSTGAGDAFAAGVLAALVTGLELTAALAAGHDLAARAVARPGARP
jgi:sugar/nucleoside kinase (ribokinase family)